MLGSILKSHDFRKTAKSVPTGSGASAGTSFGSGFPCKLKPARGFLRCLAELGNALLDLCGGLSKLWSLFGSLL